MSVIALDDTEFRGRVSSPAANTVRYSPDCQRCGSSLRGRYKGEAAGRRRKTVVHTWLCRCGRRRRIEVVT